MKTLRPIARVIIVNADKILLVRNKDSQFWYPPGGGWEFEGETLAECAKREVKEETNYDVTIDRLIWVSEFREKEKVYLETFWIAHLDDTASTDSHLNHTDLDAGGAVTEARWFTQDELTPLTVFPEQLKDFRSVAMCDYSAWLAS